VSAKFWNRLANCDATALHEAIALLDGQPTEKEPLFMTIRHLRSVILFKALAAREDLELSV
jgi:hypothetical protein